METLTKDEVKKRFLFPHQEMRNFKNEKNGCVSFEIGDHIKNDCWYVLTDGKRGGLYKTSSQYHGLFEGKVKEKIK
jgi:hypothetical protein